MTVLGRVKLNEASAYELERGAWFTGVTPRMVKGMCTGLASRQLNGGINKHNEEETMNKPRVRKWRAGGAEQHE